MKILFLHGTGSKPGDVRALCLIEHGYDEQITLNHGSGKAPQIGQLLAFGTGGSRHTYTIIEVDAVSATQSKVMLDRPLDAGVTASDDAFPGPAGSMNLALHREAIALVTRPLAVPAGAMGVLSGVGAYNGIGMRVSMQYDIDAGGTVVNCDILAGIKELDTALAVALLGQSIYIWRTIMISTFGFLEMAAFVLWRILQDDGELSSRICAAEVQHREISSMLNELGKHN